MAAGTDNLANETVTLKNSTNRFPLAYVQMQLSHSLYRCGGQLKLNWRPRELNTLADELTNEVFDHFDLAKRIQVSLDLTHRLSQHHRQILSWRQQGVCPSSKGGRSKKAKREKSKWG